MVEPARRQVTLLAGVDLAAFVVPFANRLRGAGLFVPLSALAAFTRALTAAPPMDTRALYWLARLTLVQRQHDLATFDTVFAAVFDDAVVPLDPLSRRAASPPPVEDDLMVPVTAADAEHDQGNGLPWHTLPRTTGSTDDPAEGPLLPELLPSSLEHVADVPFDDLDDEQLSLLGTWLETATRWPTRLSQRQRVQPHGRRVAMRETLARSRRTGWEPIELSRRSPVRRPRPLVMLADVSQSMQSCSTAYLHLMRAFARTGRAETFAFSTSLTRLTPTLAHRSPQVAIAQATERVTDRYGGTHLATSLRELLGSRHGNALRGGILVIASDGWDSDEPAKLAAAMARASRRAHRVIWLNPRAASPGFAPLVGSMACALPFCDDFLPAHSVRAMHDVLEAIADARGRPG